QTVVADLGEAAQADQLRAATLSEGLRAVQVEARVAVAHERVHGRAEAAVQAHVGAVVVVLLRPLGNVVVARPARACGERRLAGMTLPGNCVRAPGVPPLEGSKMFTP